MSIILAHEWIAEYGGSENVFEQMQRALPGSRSVCLWNDDTTRFPDTEETWLARSPLRGRKVAAMPFMGTAWGSVDLSDASQVVVSSHAFSHHLATRAAALGIPAFAYVHSPARYVWVPGVDRRGNSFVGRIGRRYFRGWDRMHTSPAVKYAANSRFVADRISEVWGREATVIYPPVDVDGVRDYESASSDDPVIGNVPSDFVLGASRFVSYKNLEAAIKAGEILGLPVVLAGGGPDEERLRSLAQSASVPVQFTGRVRTDSLFALYRRAALFVYMPVEDFGIMPVEAIASGTPVLVNEVGGARESVLQTGGGLVANWKGSDFADPTVVEAALNIDMTEPRNAAAAFSASSFRTNLRSWLAAGS